MSRTTPLIPESHHEYCDDTSAVDRVRSSSDICREILIVESRTVADGDRLGIGHCYGFPLCGILGKHLPRPSERT